MSTDSLEKKITDWLFEEGLTVSKVQDDKTEFHLGLPNIYGLKISIDIARPKNSPVVIFGFGIKIADQHKLAFSNLPEKEKADFIFKLQENLLHFGVDFGFLPTVQTHEVIQVTCPCYIEDLTRTSFLSTLKLARNTSLYIGWYYQNKFTGEVGPSSTPSAYG